MFGSYACTVGIIQNVLFWGMFSENTLEWSIAGIEMLFSRLFQAHIQIDGFYSLLRSEEGLKLNTEVGQWISGTSIRV